LAEEKTPPIATIEKRVEKPDLVGTGS
jgi:hypothetical protein